MKVAIYLEDGPDGLLKMRRQDLDQAEGEVARAAAQVAFNAVTEWMRDQGHSKEVDQKYTVERPAQDRPHADNVMAAFRSL